MASKRGHRPRVLVTGAGGFIGHHLTRYLLEHGFWVRGVDLKTPEFEPSLADEFLQLDLRRWENALLATEGVPLKEEDAYPADAEDGYGWEKLFMERQCRHYREDYGLATRIVRFHNVYGELGTYDGGREKSPAAICRKVALANASDTIEVWGDGQQTRSYCYVADCVEGIFRLMRSDYHEPLNLGTDRLVTINELVDIVAAMAGKRIEKRHDLTKPQGVRGRNSDNGRLRTVLGWEPQVSLEVGLGRTYRWIEAQLAEQGRLRIAAVAA